ncbi:MAG TPA: hypothetical protein VH740_15260 [Vicinamibacterales bacterium]|jgi:hypothetical protein
MPRFLLAFAVSILCAGCIRSTTSIELRADGSGTVLQETGISSQALVMLKSMAPQGTGKESSSEMFTEDQARKTAAAMGVTFVSGEPFKTAELEGYRARYSFADITQVKVNMSQGMGGASTTSKEPPFAFLFDKGATASTLTIQMTEQGAISGMNSLPGLPPGGGTTDADKAQAAQALAMMKMMLRGLFVDVSLNVDGRIVKTNAPHVEGSRVTLLQIDFDKLLADEASLLKLQSASDLKALANVPGLKVAADPKLTITFSK